VGGGCLGRRGLYAHCQEGRCSGEGKMNTLTHGVPKVSRKNDSIGFHILKSMEGEKSQKPQKCFREPCLRN
jgi:hypothetical protein